MRQTRTDRISVTRFLQTIKRWYDNSAHVLCVDIDSLFRYDLFDLRDVSLTNLKQISSKCILRQYFVSRECGSKRQTLLN